ncbi:hypothetical protein DV736_g4655, partial [Chaetothyriales sp. CBS 134916]
MADNGVDFHGPRGHGILQHTRLGARQTHGLDALNLRFDQQYNGRAGRVDGKACGRCRAVVGSAEADAGDGLREDAGARNSHRAAQFPEAVPLPALSPLRTPYAKHRSPAPAQISRSPSAASLYDAHTPAHHTKRSPSSLSVARSTTPSRPQFRRRSSNLNPASPAAAMKVPLSPQALEIQRRKEMTAATVAKDFFAKELSNHVHAQSPVAVIIHDACYGHRFSRPRTSKAALSTVVERPERMLATLLGASAAYVRLGSRHAQGRHPPHPDVEAPAAAHSVPFKVHKSTRIVPLNHAAVTHVHGTKWMAELQIMCDSAESKLAFNGRELARPIGYAKDENGNTLPKLHDGDLYLCNESLAALQGCLGGVFDAVDTVLTADSTTTRAFVCIRPPGHHCSANFPSGFCWLNNVHVGIAHAAMTHGLTHAAIIDFDLHHGDGSQAIAWAHNRNGQSAAKNAAPHKKVPIGYYSLHDINSYPCEWGDEEKVRGASLCIENAHGQSIWNVHLEPWASHQQFRELYESRYKILLDKARKFLSHHHTKLQAEGKPSKAAIFVSAGFDASEHEGAGMQRHAVNVPTEFYAKFTGDIVAMAQEEALGVGGRVISVLEGGYSDRALTSGVLSHLCGLVDDPSTNLRVAHTPGLCSSVASGSLPTRSDPANWDIDHFDPDWWSLDALGAVEAITAAHQPSAPKTGNIKPASTYSSPTHASTARMTGVARERRSLSAQFEARLSLESEPLPPYPEVDWAVAAYELSRLLIPNDRQTLSCRHDELNAEATKVRKERQSGDGLPPTQARPLRERKPKPAPVPAANVRSSSRITNRRTTITSVNDLPDPTLQDNVLPVLSTRRRSSADSSMASAFQQMNLADTGLRSTTSRAATVAPETKENPAPVKKAKATVSKVAARPRSPRKEVNSAVPSLSRKYSSASEETSSLVTLTKEKAQGRRSAQPTSQPTSRPSSRPPSHGKLAADETENLAIGVKKLSIKLKVRSAEEYAAARERKQQEEQQQKTARISRKLPVSKTTKAKAFPKQAVVAERPSSESTSRPESGPVSARISPNGRTSPPQIAPNDQDQLPNSITAPKAAEVLEAETEDAPLVHAHPLSNGSSHYTVANGQPIAPAKLPEPEPRFSGVAATASLAEERPASHHGLVAQGRPVTPRIATKAKNNNNLPVFTSTSPIPFAPRSPAPVDAANAIAQKAERMIVETAETAHQ